MSEGVREGRREGREGREGGREGGEGGREAGREPRRSLDLGGSPSLASVVHTFEAVAGSYRDL